MENKQNKKSHIGLYLLYGALTVFVLALILSFNDIEAIFSVIKTVNPTYIMLALLCILIYMALYPLSLCILTKAKNPSVSIKDTYSIAMTEHFFNGITPFATGGQPFQVYAFTKSKVTPSESTSLLLMNFFVFMLTTNGFAICSLFYFSRFVTDTAMTVIAIVGFTMNFFVLAMTLVIATSKRVCALLIKLVGFLCRFRLFSKLLGNKEDELKQYFVNVQTAFSELTKKKGAFFGALFTKILCMLAYYTTTFFILWAFHVNAPVSDLFFIICGTSFAITMVVFLPTPGSSGGIEFAFKTVFASIALGSAAEVAYGGMLIWRLLSYYLVMLISAAFYVAFEIRKSRLAKVQALTESDGSGEESEATDG